MSDLKESFAILEDDVTGAGEAAISRVEGEAGAGKAGLIGFSFKDSSGNVVLPALTAAGKLPVDIVAVAGTILRGKGLLDSGSVSAGADNDVVTIVLTVSEVYNMADYMSSCSRDCTWTLVHDDNGTEEVLESWYTGAGQYTYSEEPKNLQITAGATGTQELILRGNPRKASDLHGRVSIVDIP